jgi:putative DNA primase/helicase
MSDIMQPHAGAIGKAEARAQIDRWLIEYAEGISNRRVEAVGLATQAELDAGVVEARFARADKLRAAAIAARRGADHAKELDAAIARRAPEEGVTIRKRPLTGTAEKWDLAKALNAAEAEKKAKREEMEERAKQAQTEAETKIFSAASQPAEEPVESAQPDPAQAPQDEAAAEPERTFFAPAAITEAAAEEEVLILDPAAPLDNAKKLISLRGWHKPDRMPTLRYWQKSFWNWRGANWREVDPDTVRGAMWRHLDAAEKYVKGGKKARFEPTPAHVNATVDALGSFLNLEALEHTMPGWFGGGRPAGDLRELVACENGLLHFATRALLPHTPKFWSANVLPYRYEPQARAPRFEQFLEEVWPGDLEAQQCLLEMFGLILTDITKHQRCFMFIGPPRGGRGTIGRVLKGLIGPANYVGTSLRSLSEAFGMEDYVGKKVVVYTDVRLDGISQRAQALIVERVLSITGEDDMHINRKNAKYWNGPLTSRLVFFSNILPRLQDESGALSGRFLVFRMRQQFLRERADPNLTTKLLAERPGILNLALAALDRVRARDGLVQAASGLEMSERLTDATSHVTRFVEECCVLGTAQEIMVGTLYERWREWCERAGIRFSWEDNTFSEKLCAAVPTLNRDRPRHDVEGNSNPSRRVRLIGIGLRPGLRLVRSLAEAFKGVR